MSRLRGGGSAIPPYVSLDNQPDWERAYYARRRTRAVPRRRRERQGAAGKHGPAPERQRPCDWKAGKDLLHAFDTLRRDLDGTGAMEGIDAFQARALEMVASGKVRDAFESDKEPEKVRAHYGEQPLKVINQECNVVKYHEVEHPGRRCSGPPPGRSGRFGGDRLLSTTGTPIAIISPRSASCCPRWTRR